MQANSQKNFFDLFDQEPEPCAPPPKPVENTPAPAITFVSMRQREILRSSPFASFVRGKSLEEIAELDKTVGHELYRKSDGATGMRRLNEWRDAANAARTVALEAEYRKVDERFCSPGNGVFYLIGKDGRETAVGYKYSPFYFDSTPYRTGTPVHHLEFKSEGATEVSETGYRSHFLTFVPYSDVKDFADFIVKILRLHLKVTEKIVFEGADFIFDESLLPAPKPKKKKTECGICGERLGDGGNCLDCAGLDYEDDGGEPDEEEDLFDDLNED